VTEHRDGQRLMTVGFERGERVTHVSSLSGPPAPLPAPALRVPALPHTTHTLLCGGP
jgi:hypothetical protein